MICSDIVLLICVLKSSPLKRGVVLFENQQFSFDGTRLVGRAQPWARLLVLCSVMGLAGPSIRA